MQVVELDKTGVLERERARARAQSRCVIERVSERNWTACWHLNSHHHLDRKGVSYE
jgi:hypothetical protein